MLDALPDEQPEEAAPESDPNPASTAVAEPAEPAAAEPKQKPKPDRKPKSKTPPPYKVLLHNDDVNDMDYVVGTLIDLVRLNRQDAVLKMFEAHRTGVALVCVTHKERAELLVEQFQSKRLTATMEPA